MAGITRERLGDREVAHWRNASARAMSPLLGEVHNPRQGMGRGKGGRGLGQRLCRHKPGLLPTIRIGFLA